MILDKKDIENFIKFPRPNFRRNFISLNGNWNIKFFKNESNAIADIDGIYDEKIFPEKDKGWKIINVPYCIEAEKSGINFIGKKNYLVYYKKFFVDEILSSTASNFIILKFGAIDHYSKIYINGKQVAESITGYSPIEIYFPVSQLDKSYLEICVYVNDSVDLSFIRGNQAVINNKFLNVHTPVTGIWQPVWLEFAGEVILKNFKHTFQNNISNFCFEFIGEPKNFTFKIYDKKEIDLSVKNILKDSNSSKYYLTVDWSDYLDKTEMWSVDFPNLYHFFIDVYGENGLSDRVESYIGFRTISKFNDKIFLNGKLIYQKIVANYGIYKTGIYTPDLRTDFLADILLIKEAGFNGVRTIQKIEDPCSLFCADALGLLVWQDFPTSLNFNRVAENEFHSLLSSITDRDFNNPSLVVRTIFYKSIGLTFFKRKKMVAKMDYYYNFVKGLDDTRLVIENSCYYHWQGDIIDVSSLTKTPEVYYKYLSERVFGVANFWDILFDFFIKNRIHSEFIDIPPLVEKNPIFIGECGKIGYTPKDNNEKEFIENFKNIVTLIHGQKNISGFCFVVFSDTEYSNFGLYTLDREPKVNIKAVKNILDKII